MSRVSTRHFGVQGGARKGGRSMEILDACHDFLATLWLEGHYLTFTPIPRKIRSFFFVAWSRYAHLNDNKQGQKLSQHLLFLLLALDFNWIERILKLCRVLRKLLDLVFFSFKQAIFPCLIFCRQLGVSPGGSYFAPHSPVPPPLIQKVLFLCDCT